MKQLAKKLLLIQVVVLFLTTTLYAQKHEILLGDTTYMYQAYNNDLRMFEFHLNSYLENGDWTVYDSTKTKVLITASYRKNCKHGKVVYYYNSGTIKSVTVWSYGKMNGEYERYYDNGQIKIKGKKKKINGSLCKGDCSFSIGEWKYWDYYGKLIKTELYKNGKLVHKEE